MRGLDSLPLPFSSCSSAALETLLYPSETLNTFNGAQEIFRVSSILLLYPCNLLPKPQLCHATRRGTNLSGDATTTEEAQFSISMLSALGFTNNNFITEPGRPMQ